MADGNTHIYFGIGVLAAMPDHLRQKITRDMDAFYLGLQGPDPLIFDPRTQKEARRFHKVWEQESLGRLTRAMREGEPSESSFAAGGFLHFVLDDIVHPWIWEWMKEGTSHMRLELALDFNILREEANHYLTGLRHMQVTIDYVRRREKAIMSKLTDRETQQVAFLRKKIDEGIPPTARRLTEMLG